MGNEQSAPLGRQPQNRLSKPKTNNSTTNLLTLTLNTKLSNGKTRKNSISSNSSPATKAPYNFVPIEGFAGEAGDRWKDDQPIQQRKRMSLFRSKSSQDKPKLRLTTGLDPNSPEPSPLSSIDRPPLPARWGSARERGSPVIFETGGDEASYYESPVDVSRPQIRLNRNSLQQANQQARLSLVAEVPSPHSEIPKRQSILQEDSVSLGRAISTRSNSDAALYVPIRRKSLLAHGVATRSSYVEPDPPQPLPPRADSLNNMQNYYYNPSKPTSSPLSDLAMLGPNPAFRSDGPRAETPTDENYGHLGGFNGTLRITNGAASPAPSSRGRANSLGAEEDHSETKKNAEFGHRHGLSQRSNTISVPSEVIKSPWAAPSESPLRQAETQFEPLKVETHLPTDESLATFNFEEEKKLFKRTASPTKAQELANDYMHDLALSPFSFENSPPISPGFQVTSKHTALEDDLFDVEPDSPDLNSDHGSHLPRSFDSGYVGGENSPPLKADKELRESTSTGLAKADSGYSSNVSLRSFKKDSAKETSRRILREPESRVASSTYSVASETTLRASHPALPTEEVSEQPSRPPPPPFRQPPPVPEKESFEGAPRNIQPPPVPQMMADQACSAPPQAYAPAAPSENRPQENTLPVPGTSVREDSPAISDASTSPGSSSRWRQKLTKRESSQHRIETAQVFTVQAIRSPSDPYKILPPTVEARRRLEEREEAFPVQTFPNTIEGTVASRRMSMGTIFSVGSLEIGDEPNFARPPVPPMPTILQEPTQQTRPDKSRRHTYQAPARFPPQPAQQETQLFKPVSRERDPSPGQRANWGRQSFDAIPRDRVAQQIEDFENHVASLETVSSSLGHDAYDIARPDSRPAIDQRAKSMTAQFEADAAARFAASKQRNVSAASEASTVIRPRKSYDSIANGNPYGSGSGSSTPTSSRTVSRDTSSLVLNSAMRRSTTNLPAQPSLLNPSSVERRKSSRSPPPVSMPPRLSSPSVARKPLPPPKNSPAPPSPTKTPPTMVPSPLRSSQEALAWENRRKSTVSLYSTRTVSYDNSRKRPETYNIVMVDDFKRQTGKNKKNRASTIGTPSLMSDSAPNSRPTSSKGKGKSRESLVLSIRDRDELPRTNFNEFGQGQKRNMAKSKKSKESLHLHIRPRSSGGGPSLDAVSERDEIPRFSLTSPTLQLQPRRSMSKDNIGGWRTSAYMGNEDEIPEMPRVAYERYVGLGAGDMGGRRELLAKQIPLPPKPKRTSMLNPIKNLKFGKSEETLTLRESQGEELAKRRPRSVQPSRKEQKLMRAHERSLQEGTAPLPDRLEKERGREREKSYLGKVKEMRRERWEAYKDIFGGDREKRKLKEKISSPIAIPASEVEAAFANASTPSLDRDMLDLDRFAMRNNIMGNVRVQG